MIRRTVRRNIIKTVLGLLITIVIFSVITLFVFSLKYLLPLLKFGSEQKNLIIKPVSELTSKDDLSKVLYDKNFIMESLVESSSSGLIIGKIRGGPKVYFSRNKDAKWQVLSLELILSKLMIDNKKPTLIDLQFEQPIVKF